LNDWLALLVHIRFTDCAENPTRCHFKNYLPAQTKTVPAVRMEQQTDGTNNDGDIANCSCRDDEGNSQRINYQRGADWDAEETVPLVD